MMALAHGAKGIFYWNYYSYAKYDSTCEVKLLIDAIVDSFGTPSNLYYTLRDTIFPRLNGDLGEGLFRINYTGDYITYQCSGGGFAQSPITLDYLTLPGLPPTETTSLQAGFFSREGHSDDKYFFLVNLLTNATKSIVIKVTPPVGGFTNYRLRDYEGVFDTTFTSSPFYYTASHLAGDGHLYEVAPVVEYGGKLITNETISGTKTLYDDMIIKDGITLTITGDYTIEADVTVYGDIVVAEGGSLDISPGVNIHLYNDAAITVIGDMQAVGTSLNKIIFDGEDWGSIIYNGSSSSEISYAEIRDGDGIQILNDASVLIDHCLIEDCTEGIYVYNSEPIISDNQIINPLHNGINADAYELWITVNDNIIMKDTGNTYYKQYQGLFLQNRSNEMIYHNDIKGFYWGIYGGGGSGALFGEPLGPSFNPNNRIDSCSFGMGIGWGAYFVAGSGTSWAYSSIYDNDSYDIYVYHSATAYAENNYWGGGAPYSYVDGTSFLDYNPYLTEDPWDERGMKPTGGDDVENKGLTKMTMGFDDLMELIEGRKLEERGQIIEAISLYKGLVLNNTAVEPSLGRLLRIAIKQNHPELLEYLYQKISNPGLIGQEVILRLKANIKTQLGDYQGAMAAYDELAELNTSSYQMLSAKFSKLFLVIDLIQDANLAQEILSDITSYPIEEDELIMKLDLAQSLLAQLIARGANSNMGKENTKENLLPEKYALYQNYPNPFNPVTTIKYDLPKASQVSLIIYDILGEKITELVNQRQEAGRYEVQFDGSRLASGIYLYQINAG